MLETKRLARALSASDATEIHEWWRRLPSDVRHELTRDPGRPPRRLVARFVEPDEPAEEPGDFYEHLVNHEVTLDDGPVFHICTALPEARAAIRAGRIPAGFSCPRAIGPSSGCPMRRLLDRRPGHDLQLSLEEGERR